MSTRQVLERTLEIVRDEGWCQGVYALTEEGKCVSPTSPEAVVWCVEGAITRAYNELGQDSSVALTGASHILMGVVGEGHITWNDTPGRTRDQIIDALKEAIVRCPLEDE